MNYLKAASLAAAMALAAGGAFAQAGAGASASGTGSAGTTGKAVGTSAAADASVTATGIAPSDGSNAQLEPGMYGSMDELRASRGWTNGGYAMPYHSETRVMGNTSAKITHYYVDVPNNVTSRGDFRRWSQLQ